MTTYGSSVPTPEPDATYSLDMPVEEFVELLAEEKERMRGEFEARRRPGGDLLPAAERSVHRTRKRSRETPADAMRKVHEAPQRDGAE